MYYSRYNVRIEPPRARSAVASRLNARLCVIVGLLVFVPLSRAAAQSPAAKAPVSFINDVAPILKENCFACHDSKKRKGKLDMTTYESLRKGGDGLPKEKIAVIGQWIREGAKLDAGLDPKGDLLRELRIRWQPPTPPARYQYPVTITALAFAPDNKKLIVGGFHELTIWDFSQPQVKLEKRIYTRAERAYAMVFLPDGMLAVAGGR